MKKDRIRFVSFIFITIILASCANRAVPPMTPNQPSGASATIPPADANLSTPGIPTSTADACSPEKIEAEVQKIHNHMREFDDASILASNLPREELSDSIANLQRIRREAEDEEVPPCLSNLKAYQIDHMNTVINTLVAFVGGTETETLEQAIAVAREQHDQYTLELAKLLGLTVVPATESAVSTPNGTSTP